MSLKQHAATPRDTVQTDCYVPFPFGRSQSTDLAAPQEEIKHANRQNISCMGQS